MCIRRTRTKINVKSTGITQIALLVKRQKLNSIEDADENFTYNSTIQDPFNNSDQLSSLSSITLDETRVKNRLKTAILFKLNIFSLLSCFYCYKRVERNLQTTEKLRERFGSVQKYFRLFTILKT